MRAIDTITSFTGGLGAGKTFTAVKCARKAYIFALIRYYVRKAVFKLFRKKDKLTDLYKPGLYANIPIRLPFRKNKYCLMLKAEHLLLQERIPEDSVVLIDEFSHLINQFAFRGVNSEVLDEFVRLFRQYIDGKLIITDQCSDNIVLQLRRRLNIVHNMFRIRFLPFGKFPFISKFNFFVFFSYRDIFISEEIKSVGSDEPDKTMNEQFAGIRHGFAFLFPKSYESRCFKNRYKRLPWSQNQAFDSFFTNQIIRLSGKKVKPLTDHDPDAPESEKIHVDFRSSDS